MTQEIFYRPHKARCADGVIRSARVRSYYDGRRWCMHGDTYFSVPAVVTVARKTIRGYVTTTDEGLEFQAYQYRKNHQLIVSKGGP